MTKSTVGVHEAKTHLSRLLERVAAGEEILIARRGEVVARLVGPEVSASRRFGTERGRVRIASDFDDPLPEDLQRALGA
jgi:prevent-host-death family protein